MCGRAAVGLLNARGTPASGRRRADTFLPMGRLPVHGYVGAGVPAAYRAALPYDFPITNLTWHPLLMTSLRAPASKCWLCVTFHCSYLPAR